ncbi:MAG: hypothetical protein ACP5N7_01665 [Candidatus Pacearchaeota archaeon]
MDYGIKDFLNNFRSRGLLSALVEDSRRTAEIYVDYAVRLRDDGSLLGALLMIPIEAAYSLSEDVNGRSRR